MKLIFGIVLILSLLAKDFAAFSWDVWFYINQQEIAAEKCENKAKPMMHCDGKCYLAKQLKKLEEKEKNHHSKRNPFQKIEKVELLQHMVFTAFYFNGNANSEKEIYTYKETYSNKHLNAVFRPPLVG